MAALAALRVAATLGLIGIMLVGSAASKPEVYDDIENYTEYMSFSYDSPDTRWNKWGMDETIWPLAIKDVSDVVDFKMVYYDPWDAQYLGYLVMDYPAEDYAAETARLKEYPSTDYIGYYSVTEERTYELLAVYADEYNGFVYALTDGNSRIIYAEEIFCNYSMDLDYRDYIPEDYLLDGFNAASGKLPNLVDKNEI
ncbi:MAG: hypothetical protein IJ930_10275 [Lachnospiraceae bacterium]|nr:hypothetical protein [Lachnospiraceae bacterium]